MELQLVIFLAFVSVTVIANSLLIWMMYRGVAGLTLKVTETVREFETSSEAKAWMGALHHASVSAMNITEETRRRIQDYDPRLEEMQARYEYTLARIDAKIERNTSMLSERLQRVQDAIEQPAHTFGAVAAGVQNALEMLSSRNGR